MIHRLSSRRWLYRVPPGRCNRGTGHESEARIERSVRNGRDLGETTMVRTVMVVIASLMLGVAVQSAAAGDEGTLVYELRTYTTYPGKLDDLHKRFREHTMQLFEKHGIKNVAYFVPRDKPDTLIYLIAHKSHEAALQSWAAFRSDPEWQRVSKESEKNGKIVKNVVSVYMTPTDYSPIK
jgi:predicted GIY-YIG superfamily endonuclease